MIYWAASLYNPWDLKRNDEMVGYVENKLGIPCFLPQRDGGIAYDQIKTANDIIAVRRRIFEGDIYQLTQRCDSVVAVLDGPHVDDGVAVELGISYGIASAIKMRMRIGLHSDQRSLDKYGVSLMVEGTLSHLVNSDEELYALIEKNKELM